jgi:hypothetical protein
MALLAWSAAGGLVAAIGLRVALGFDLLRSLHALRDAVQYNTWQLSRPRSYWFFAQYAIWLTYAGLPLAVGGLRALLSRHRAKILVVLAPVAVYYSLPTRVSKLIPGETERTWLFLVPFVAVAVAALLQSHVSHERRAWIIGGLVVLAGSQAIVLNALFLNYY